MEPIDRSNRRCQHCRGRMSKDMRSDAKYCGTDCRKAASHRRRRLAAKAGEGKYSIEHIDGMTPGSAKNLDKLAREIDERGLFDRWRAGELTYEQIGMAVSVEHRTQVKRAIEDIVAGRARALAQADWERDPEITHMLALDLEMPDHYDEEACRRWAEAVADRFLLFEHRFFATPHERTQEVITFIRKPFHREWLVAILYAWATGGYLQILSPPRHGKSQLLAHFCVWLICRNPNIRILWVGPIEPTAARFVDLVKIKLTNHELVEATLPPGVTYEPVKKGPGTVWNKGEFVVDCRLDTIVGSTMLAVGRGANSILSLNADVIVCDDIENHKSCEIASSRKSTRDWFGIDLDSRKMEHTPMIVIGSRQHYDDLYSYNLEDPGFENVVNSAHDVTCSLDPENLKIHIDCVLFPELRSYAWLRSKQIGGKARKSEGEYTMVYLNDPRMSGLTIFEPADYDQCRNVNRVLGPAGIPAIAEKIPRSRRIASLDPSATGFQAAIAIGCTVMKRPKPTHDVPELGMYDVQDYRLKRWLLDMVDDTGGGIENFLRQAEKWRVELGIYHWVIEEKGFQNYRVDPRVQQWRRRHDVHISPHRTETNKWDAQYGVGAMSRIFREQLFDLPYGDAHSRAMVDLLRRQALAFVDIPLAQSRKVSDSLMALWFPQKTIRRWEKEDIAEFDEIALSLDNPYPTSYPDLAGFTQDMNTAPWS